jgi:hypothetical protein
MVRNDAKKVSVHKISQNPLLERFDKQCLKPPRIENLQKGHFPRQTLTSKRLALNDHDLRSDNILELQLKISTAMQQRGEKQSMRACDNEPVTAR